MFKIEDLYFDFPTLRKASDVGGNSCGHMKIDNTIQDKLSRFGYSQVWLEIGLLTKEQLEQQISQLDSGEDDNIEHYRYRTLIDYFNQQNSFEDLTLRQILQLLQSDDDKQMAASSALNLLKKSVLNDQQFETVAGFVSTFGAGQQ